MFQKKKLIAEYKEKIKLASLEETDHIEDQFFPGFVPFFYESVKDNIKVINDNGIERTVFNKVLITTDDLPFKNGDRIRLDGKDTYSIVLVERKLPKKYESVVAMHPSISYRYEQKVITLNDNR